MNTPTPAQALGEVLQLSEKATQDWRRTPRKLSGGVVVGGPFHEYTNGSAQAQVAMFCHMSDDEHAQENNSLLAIAAVNFIRQHGQHFAGLEKEAAELRAWKAEEVAFLLKAAAMFGGTGYKGEGILGGIEHLKSELAMEQRHYAQAREDYAALSAEFRRQIKEAEARVREAEGLLRHWQAWICGPSELHKATATFLATSGESK